MSGVIGGPIGYHVLRQLGRANAAGDGHGDGSAYEGRSKLEVLFGDGIWDLLSNRTVVDFGCGLGTEVIDMARHGVQRAIGLDIRDDILETAQAAAAKAGVAERCRFVTELSEPADVVISIDGFEHYENPERVLKIMRGLLRDDGFVLVSFGPPWYHPYGGHIFSIFPWAHLIFTEPALIRWRSDFKTDGATCFSECAGGLSQMSVRRFREILADSDFDFEELQAVPIRRLRWLANALTRELFTSTVRCKLVPRPNNH